MADDNQDGQNGSGGQGSPRYIDETMEADENLRPDTAETEDRQTDKDPNIGE